MPVLIPSRSTELLSQRGRSPRMTRHTEHRLALLEEQTLLRLAAVQGEAMVQQTKLREVDHLTRTAQTGHAMLRGWASTLAGSDPSLYDELRFFVDMARMGKGEILADTIDSFCRESRR